MSVDSMDAVVPAGPGVRSVVSPPVRVAVVGCGAMTRENLMPVLCGYERIRLVALVDVNEANARALADSYGVPAVLTSLDALTKDLVDAVMIATPPAFHAPQAIELARQIGRAHV